MGRGGINTDFIVGFGLGLGDYSIFNQLLFDDVLFSSQTNLIIT